MLQPVQPALGAAAPAAAVGGTWSQPLDRADPTGDRVTLRIARLRSTALEPATDALTIFNGGPGGSSIDLLVDLGGIAKEYAVDRTVALLRNAGITSGLVELAGDVAVIGSQGDETPWSVAIRDPRGSGSLCSVSLVDAALATSGNYARTLAYGGKEYGHLLDPRSGWPVPGPDSVSVIDAHCLSAGAVASVACLKHQDEATDWLRASRLPWLLCNAGTPPVGPIADALSARVG